jgi:AmmeMemoRadiSam system protein A
MLTQGERQEIIQIARESIARGLQRRSGRAGIEGGAFREAPWKGSLAAPGGAFVTIHVLGNLRGCIGYIESHLAVGQVVEEVAQKAAFDDPRFPPLTDHEFPEICLEVSLLSPLCKVSRVEEIEVGKHGLLIEYGTARGLLLPQVATEYGWDREAFLENVSRKAGLPRNIWRDPKAALYTFTAEIVDETPADTKR